MSELSRTRSTRRTIGITVFAVVAMFGFGFALVPLYDIICEVTGLNGKTNRAAIAATDVAGSVDKERTITIEFITSLNGYAPWEFKPSVAKMQVHPGEFYNTTFLAKNLTDQALSGQGVPSVAPFSAARHFQKIECFCFNRQDFGPGESKDMPVIFRVDPKLAPGITTITLSYTFYNLEPTDS